MQIFNQINMPQMNPYCHAGHANFGKADRRERRPVKQNHAFVELPIIQDVSAPNQLGIKKCSNNITNDVQNMNRVQSDTLGMIKQFSPNFGVMKKNQKVLNSINDIQVIGMKDNEKDLLGVIKDSIYDLLDKTDETVSIPEKIIFKPYRVNGEIKKNGIMCVNRDNELFFNRDYIDNIDEVIKFEIDELINHKCISKDDSGKYKILDHLRNDKSQMFEEKLNQYSNTQMTLADKFKFQEGDLGYYFNASSVLVREPSILIMNILSKSVNQNILKEMNLLKTVDSIEKMTKTEQTQYLKDITKVTTLPIDSVLITTPQTTIWHEIGHLHHYSSNTAEFIDSLNSPELINQWQNNDKVQKTTNKVSAYATYQPMEFVADVWAGLANGQKFDSDVTSLYDYLGGPTLEFFES